MLGFLLDPKNHVSLDHKVDQLIHFTAKLGDRIQALEKQQAATSEYVKQIYRILSKEV